MRLLFADARWASEAQKRATEAQIKNLEHFIKFIKKAKL
jgi:hypothetical protein